MDESRVSGTLRFDYIQRGPYAESLWVSARRVPRSRAPDAAGRRRAEHQPGVRQSVTDVSGGVLPGVTVTLSSPALLEPRVAVTSETGTYEFSGLPIGVYAVRFELAGFGTVVRDALQLPSGFNAQVNGELAVAGLQENVVVTGVNPIVDIRSTTQGTRFNVEELQAIPSTRDVFQVLTQTPGISSDRQNVGGTHNGQQIGHVLARRWQRSGPMVRRRCRPERHRQWTAVRHRLQFGRRGAGVDRRGRRHDADPRRVRQRRHQERIGRVPRLDLAVPRPIAISDRQTSPTSSAREGANSGNPLVYTNDYGGQLGGPIKKGRAWFWAPTECRTCGSASSTITSRPPSAPRGCQPARLRVRRCGRLPEHQQTGCAGARPQVQPAAVLGQSL